MKYGIISDIHANYTALKKVLEFLEGEGVEKIINCGDIIGYGPQPNECVEEIKKRKNALNVIGNHDFAILKITELLRFNTQAADSVRWTVDKLSPENRDFISERELRKNENGFTFMHGTPRRPLDEYLLGVEQASHNFSEIEQPLCFVGHTHCPSFFRLTEKGKVEEILFIPEKTYVLRKEEKYIINPGSVGQPRDGTPQAGCIIYDKENKTLNLYRLDYDIKKVQDMMRKAGLPEYLSSRLEIGR